MTGLAPISDATVVGANSVAAANSGTPSAESQRASDFSATLNAANPPQSAQADAPGKNVIAAPSNSTRAPKTSTPQANLPMPAAPAHVATAVAAPVLTVSALLTHAAAPLPPPVPAPVPPPAANAPNLLAAASDLPVNENAAIAARAAAASVLPAQSAIPTGAIGSDANSPSDTAETEIANTAASTANLSTNDLDPAQTGTTQAVPGYGSADVASAAQPAADADQSAVTAAEVAAIMFSAAGRAAAGDSSQVEVGSAQGDATNSTAATPLAATAKGNSDQPALTAAASAPPTNHSVQDKAPVSQTLASDTALANSTVANATLQKEISDARDKLVQTIGANLQAEISAAPGKAISSADPANGAGTNLAQQNPGNSAFNSSAQDLLQQYGDPATSIAASLSGDSSGDTNGLTANGVTSAAAKAVALATAAIDSVAPHAMLGAAPQIVSTAAAPTTSASPSTNGASTARPEPSQQPLPQPLPQSLNDVAKASEMYQRVGGSEMHIAMETDLLGAVDLRATMHQSALTATIGVQRADVQALLSNELPALQHALADKNFHVEQISVLNNSVGDRAGSGGQQQTAAQNQNQNPFTARAGYPPSVAATAASDAADLRTMAGAPSMAQAWSDDSGRISVHV